MAHHEDWTFAGDDGQRVARTWTNDEPRYVALLCHGYGEHIGRYEYVADTLAGHGAVVYGADHVGHGKSHGERVLIDDYERVVEDFHHLTQRAGEEHPDLPTVLIGHSMGGMIAVRYAQKYGDELAAVVLSAPVLGRWDVVTRLLPLDEIPETPIDPETLSRDPEVGQEYAADPLVWHGKFKRGTLQALATTLSTIDQAGSLGELPTLWLHGSADQLVPIDGTQAGIERIRGPRLDKRVFDGARHEVFNETNRDEVLQTVTAFIDEQLPR
ncbi:MAG: alpha/beta hydrolase [Propionibacteriales bacterium]|nr:alpha/beta hydrolase [Propionibacteriales bacterium]